TVVVGEIVVVVGRDRTARLRSGSGAQGAAPSEITGGRDAMEIVDMVRDEQRVVVAVSESCGLQISVALAGKTRAKRLRNDATAERPTRGLVECGPEISDSRVADRAGVLGGDCAGAIGVAGAIRAACPAQSRFEKRLSSDSIRRR